MMAKNIYQNREISVLSFNERVLQEAEDSRNPLLERLRFLGIFSSNMDEFFKVRVASIHRRLEVGEKQMTAVLEKVNEKSRELDHRFRTVYSQLIASLAKEGIALYTEEDLRNQPQEIQDWAKDHFADAVLPSLVPLIVDETHPFPHLTDGGLYFGVVLQSDTPPFAILEIPSTLPRFVELPDKALMYVDDLIRFSLADVFCVFDNRNIEAYEFKISRDAELDMDDDFTEGFVRKMQKVLSQRKGGRPTRFVYDDDMPKPLLNFLLDRLKIGKGDTLIPGGRYHNMKDLMKLPVKRKDLSFAKSLTTDHPQLDPARKSVIEVVAERDILVTYPYQSFDHLIRLLREAAIDPRVKTIRMTMYRAARNSQVVNALINAARNGKEVFVCVELQARFDEENNIAISEQLSEAGATVVYGVPPLKVHSKLIVVERDDVSIAGFSTGNFNETTARLYVDSLLLTAQKRMVREANHVFRFFDNASRVKALSKARFRELLVSPFTLRSAIEKLIDRERKKGKDGYIFIKANHLTDARVTKKLRKAAAAGVPLDLVIRTTYAMEPHKNIRPISILDQFLEHQRVFIFGKGDDRMIYLSSADLMERNLDWRIEVAFPIHDPELAQEVADVMRFQIQDTYKGRILDEKQSNQYMPKRWKRYRCQARTHAYFQSLYKRAQRANGRGRPAPKAKAETAETAKK